MLREKVAPHLAISGVWLVFVQTDQASIVEALAEHEQVRLGRDVPLATHKPIRTLQLQKKKKPNDEKDW